MATSVHRQRASSGKTKPRGAQAIDWIQDHCRIPEGRDVGEPVKLRGWQKAEIRKIYDNPVGTRRAILSFGRKNAKTTLSAFLLLLHLCGPRSRVNSQLYSSAQSRDQAAILFSLAAKIVRMSPTLREAIIVRDTAKELVCPERGTKYRALSADASTAYGLSPVFIVHDELGQVRGPRSELYEALETATGAQEDPLSLIISTQAPTDADLLSVLIDDAMAGHDPRTVCSLYTAPKAADPFAEATIKLANPAYGDFLNKQVVQEMAAGAQRMASREASYRNLVLNQRVEASNPFVSQDKWNACGSVVQPIDDVPVYGGLDLSAVLDLTALVLVGKVDKVWQVHPTFWLPGDGLAEKAAKDRVPYDLWYEQGFLNAAPGRSVDYEYISEYLREVFARYDIRKIGFDAWAWPHLKPWLIKAGFTEDFIAEKFVEFRQGTKSMTPALRALQGEIENQRLAHGMHPVLANNAGNAVVHGPEHDRKFDKKKSAGRIDGMVALAMAMAVAPLDDNEPVPWFMSEVQHDDQPSV